jgi:hypothetical protein
MSVQIGDPFSALLVCSEISPWDRNLIEKPVVVSGDEIPQLSRNQKSPRSYIGSDESSPHLYILLLFRLIVILVSSLYLRFPNAL